jgi:hypothetical protein
MSRKSLPPEQRKTGPGTGGRNVARDAEICALKKTTKLSTAEIGARYGINRETVRVILNAGERNERDGIVGWMSAPDRRAHRERMWAERERNQSGA